MQMGTFDRAVHMGIMWLKRPLRHQQSLSADTQLPLFINYNMQINNKMGNVLVADNFFTVRDRNHHLASTIIKIWYLLISKLNMQEYLTRYSYMG